MSYTIQRVGFYVKVPDRFADALPRQLETALAGFPHSEFVFREDDPREALAHFDDDEAHRARTIAYWQGVVRALGLDSEPPAPEPAVEAMAGS